MPRTRADLLVAILLALLLGGIYSATMRPGQDWGGDFSQYINHARNIALGRPYLETRYVITFPEAATHMPTSYPPVFPLLLAPIYARFGLNYFALKIVPAWMFALSAVTLYVLARLRGLSIALSAAVAGAFGLSGIVVDMKDSVISDSTYLFFSGLALIALVWIDQRGWDRSHPLRSGVAVSVLLLLAYASRAGGLFLVAAFIFYEALWKRRVRTFNAVVLLGFVIGAAVLARTIYDSRSYANPFVFHFAELVHTGAVYLRSPASLWSHSPTPLRYAFFGLSLILCGIGWTQRIVTKATVVECYMITVIAAVIAYSAFYNAGRTDRYLMPIFPLYLIYAVEGLLWLRDKFPGDVRGRRRWLPVGVCAALAVGAAFNLHGMPRGPYAQGVEQPTFRELCDFLNVRGGRALLISWNPRVLALYTGLPTAWYPYTTDDADFDTYVDRVQAGSILVYLGNEDDRQWLLPHMQRQPNRFQRYFSNADFLLYRAAGSGE